MTFSHFCTFYDDSQSMAISGSFLTLACLFRFGFSHLFTWAGDGTPSRDWIADAVYTIGMASASMTSCYAHEKRAVLHALSQQHTRLLLEKTFFASIRNRGLGRIGLIQYALALAAQ